MCLTTDLTTTRPQFNNYRGVAQLIARRIWDAEAASLSLATPTKNPLKPSVSEDFSYRSSLFLCLLRYKFC